MKNILLTFWEWVTGVKYDLELPPSWPMDTCWDCKTPMQRPYWEKFVEISGKQYSVPHCDTCMERQEAEIRKANRSRIGADYPTMKSDDPPQVRK